MAIQDIVDYIKANKDKHSVKELVDELRHSGYPDSEITEAIEILKRPVPPPPPAYRSAPAPAAKEGSTFQKVEPSFAPVPDIISVAVEGRELNGVRPLGEGGQTPFNSAPLLAPSPAPVPPVTVESAIAKTGGVESFLGKWAYGVVGMVAVLAAMSWLLKMAFDAGIIPEPVRVIMGLVAGAIFVMAGEYVRPRITKYSYLLSATGLGLLYLSAYSTYGYYHFVPAGAALAFMSAVTLFGVALSIHADAQELAILTGAMGFIVPYFFGMEAAGDIGYFAYAIILNLGVLLLSFFKDWKSLIVLGFVGMIIHFTSWMSASFGPEKKLMAVYALAIFFLLYLVATVLAKMYRKSVSDSGDLFVLLVNPIWSFWMLYYGILGTSDGTISTTMAVVAVFVSILYILLAYFAKSFDTVDAKFSRILGSVSGIFLTLAIPLYFEKNAMTIAWASEAVLLMLIASSIQNKGMGRASLIVLILAVCRVLFIDPGVNFDSVFVPILNIHFFTYLVVIVALALVNHLFIHFIKTEEPKDVASVSAVIWVAVAILGLIAGGSEISSYYGSKTMALENKIQAESVIEAKKNTPTSVIPPADGIIPADDNQGYDYRFGNAQSAEYYRLRNEAEPDFLSLRNRENAFTSVFLSIYAIILILAGITGTSITFRYMGLGLFGITIFKVFLVDLASLATVYKVISLLVLGLILLAVSYLYFKYQKTIAPVPSETKS